MQDEKRKAAYEKLKDLKLIIYELGNVAVAYSGGVDSTFLLKVAHEVLGNKAIAVTSNTTSFTEKELEETIDFCRKNGICQVVCDIDLLSIPAFANNSPDRCYHCKKHIFSTMMDYVKQNGNPCILEGSNVDDDVDYRPGHQAIAELKILSPLRQAGLTKEEIRFLSKEIGLYTWNKPSFACLASRFVYGEEITKEKLEMVAKAEDYLSKLGLSQYRVRVHGNLARIELLPEEFLVVLGAVKRMDLKRKFNELGFSYVTLDLAGYRTGSMNEALTIGDNVAGEVKDYAGCNNEN